MNPFGSPGDSWLISQLAGIDLIKPDVSTRGDNKVVTTLLAGPIGAAGKSDDPQVGYELLDPSYGSSCAVPLMAQSGRILGDAPGRSYAAKLEAFARFAAPEFRRILSDLTLPAQGTALDLGCGTGATTALLSDALGPGVTLVGIDLSLPHLLAGRRRGGLWLLQADAEQLCFPERTFDFIWSCNTINHIADRLRAVITLRRHLRAGGRLALAQGNFLPEMYFAWDSHLDDAVRVACHRYYRERYGLEAADTAGVRSIVGLMRAAGFEELNVRTYAIERIQPLSAADREYFQTAVFEVLRSDKVRTFLDPASLASVERNCDPASPDYCLDRDDFHHIQTVTVCQGRVAERSWRPAPVER